MPPRVATCWPPMASISFRSVMMPESMEVVILGSCIWMALISCVLSLVDRKSVPMLVHPEYAGLLWKNDSSFWRAACMLRLSLMSFCPRLTTATHPFFSRTARPSSTSRASVPRSMMSSFVSTPMVRSPAGSTSRARCSASEVARSALAGVTARIMAFSPLMYVRAMFSKSCTMDFGCPSIGTFVRPGISTMVRLGTLGE
mmetsp:Transcript_5727/g.16370  ORF Transcript_5727/g.16370 Transcript_5727/m.16370 type:complete len:200 (+) Transcript_5727:1420-2019(+)